MTSRGMRGAVGGLGFGGEQQAGGTDTGLDLERLVHVCALQNHPLLIEFNEPQSNSVCGTVRKPIILSLVATCHLFSVVLSQLVEYSSPATAEGGPLSGDQVCVRIVRYGHTPQNDLQTGGTLGFIHRLLPAADLTSRRAFDPSSKR